MNENFEFENKILESCKKVIYNCESQSEYKSLYLILSMLENTDKDIMFLEHDGLKIILNYTKPLNLLCNNSYIEYLETDSSLSDTIELLIHNSNCDKKNSIKKFKHNEFISKHINEFILFTKNYNNKNLEIFSDYFEKEFQTKSYTNSYDECVCNLCTGYELLIDDNTKKIFFSNFEFYLTSLYFIAGTSCYLKQKYYKNLLDLIDMLYNKKNIRNKNILYGIKYIHFKSLLIYLKNFLYSYEAEHTKIILELDLKSKDKIENQNIKDIDKHLLLIYEKIKQNPIYYKSLFKCEEDLNNSIEKIKIDFLFYELINFMLDNY